VTAAAQSAAMLAVSDIHGHQQIFINRLTEHGLIDDDLRWTGGNVTLWCLGDYVDRGPDGLATIDLIRQLQGQAPASSGRVNALLGNHEVQLLAAKHFGTTPMPGLGPFGNWFDGWHHFGGKLTDLHKLTDEHIAWINELPVLATAGETLVMHSDTDRYLELGTTIEEVNAAAHEILQSRDVADWTHLCDILNGRGAFLHAGPPHRMLDTFGVTQLMHGHSTLRRHFGLPAHRARAPHRYADGHAIAIDGGVFEDGGSLVIATVAGDDT
jgi:hypothetical protein